MKTWQEYYDICRQVYPDSKNNVNDLRCIICNSKNNLMNFDQRYYDTISACLSKIDKLFQNKNNIAVRKLAISLEDIYFLQDELELLVSKYYAPFLEKNVFGCYVHCDNVKIYKTPPSKSAMISSWKWHIDNNPQEQIKIMIYFDEVLEKAGPLTILRDPSETPIKMQTSRKDHSMWKDTPNFSIFGEQWNSTRVPLGVVEKLKKRGYSEDKISSHAGTAIVFDNNIIHRGDIPTERIRTAATLQFKPVHFKMKKYIDKRYTGNGWHHKTFNIDPEIYTPKEIR